MIDELAVLGEGHADGVGTERRIPSMYVDPVAWLVLAAIDAALAECPDSVQKSPDDVAVILISTHATRDTMAEIAGGRLSPLRFAGASPGGAASLACRVHGFRGPSLLLTTGPQVGRQTALTVAQSWLRTGAAAHVVLSAHTTDPHHVHSVVLATQR
ncbi:hypothetical protein ALI144C_09880 [Actinosynnema sp. ALI-1.44]|uniref:hypothetical protein n=1 Tax=Actinosynnema sp. ALI-1.44 TaxID=1933779 RepID=UPI00097C7D86|nr:hypothetical protein [Actinosynnema sp. ALI-1.44]ONI86952.1 hypothetical protein ALI144C_09880 [Actinosynnema sp. ALI-1.44]